MEKYIDPFRQAQRQRFEEARKQDNRKYKQVFGWTSMEEFRRRVKLRKLMWQDEEWLSKWRPILGYDNNWQLVEVYEINHEVEVTVVRRVLKAEVQS
jgi:hypothetical protein